MYGESGRMNPLRDGHCASPPRQRTGGRRPGLYYPALCICGVGSDAHILDNPIIQPLLLERVAAEQARD